MTERATASNQSPIPREIAQGGVVLTLTPDQVYVEFAETVDPRDIEALLARYRLRPARDESSPATARDRAATLPQRRWLRTTRRADVAQLIGELRANDQIRTASPVYHRADRLPEVTGASFADRVLVRLVPRATDDEIGILIAALGTDVVATAPDPREGNLYQLRLRSPKSQNVFAVAEEFARSPLVRYAGPDWIQLHSPISATTPNDTYFAKQWNLSRIGAPGAWDISKGLMEVVIAVIDTGCRPNHPDLVGKLVPVADRRDVINGTNSPDDISGHGTLVAGVAAAETDNIEGVSGVGWHCSIMPIRLIDTDNDGNDFMNSEINIVSAIDWARTHWADVINMSWRWDGPHENADVALDSAHAAGIVLVATTGNCEPKKDCTNPAFVVYPGSHRKVIAVGASDAADRRKRPVSVRERRPWHSQYGPEISVVAPGVIPWTTNFSFDDKGNVVHGYGDFWGTSAAAPQVAGLAGLLVTLLRNPVNIPPWFQTNDLVWNIIEQTAAKVGGYNYATVAGHPNGTWHEEMGYGRIDAAAALRYARDKYTTYKQERTSSAYAVSVQILLGLIGGGEGVVLPHGGGPVPVDPSWDVLAPEKRDVLLGLAVTQLAEEVDDPETRQALARAGWEAIERAAQRTRSS
jgi:subtilisin family serine protease